MSSQGSSALLSVVRRRVSVAAVGLGVDVSPFTARVFSLACGASLGWFWELLLPSTVPLRGFRDVVKNT